MDSVTSPPPRSARHAAASKDRPVAGAAPFGLAVFLASLAMIFLSTLAGYAYIRLGAPEWPPAGAPPLPRGLWLSTVLLVVSSATIHAALVGARADRQRLVRAGLLATTVLGLGFLACQAVAWRALAERMPITTATQYSFTFYLLTVLHAVHVVGGLGPLLVATVRGLRGRYGPGDHTGVTLVAIYWHFLDVMWLLVFMTLVVVG
jgi:cytochrome c oxidase subunit 3